LEDDAAFPAALSAFLQWMYDHRPERLASLKAPVKKGGV
jgi:hypothetical protein